MGSGTLFLTQMGEKNVRKICWLFLWFFIKKLGSNQDVFHSNVLSGVRCRRKKNHDQIYVVLFSSRIALDIGTSTKSNKYRGQKVLYSHCAKRALAPRLQHTSQNSLNKWIKISSLRNKFVVKNYVCHLPKFYSILCFRVFCHILDSC